MQQVCVIVDFHVHFHECFELDCFLDAALTNLSRLGNEISSGSPLSYALLLADTSHHRAFGRLAKTAGRSRAKRWSIYQAGEMTSLIAENREGNRLILVAGRQIATAEGLEVLALNSANDHPDGRRFTETVREVLGAGSVAVVPWGFGKWTFRRKQIVSESLWTIDARGFFLGDNGGRPRIAPTPKLFADARAWGIRILPGSDPLPFPSHVGRAGSYACVIEADLREDRLAASVTQSLLSCDAQPRIVGSRQSLGASLGSQLRMRIKKHVGRS